MGAVTEAVRAHPGPRPENGCAVAGFVLSLLALVPIYGVFFAVAGTVVSAIGVGQSRGARGARRLAVAGLTASIALGLAQIFAVGALCWAVGHFRLD